MTTISFKISDDLAARVDATARARRTTRSELLREALEEKLALEDTADIRPTLLELAGDLCGKVSSGIPDLGSNPRHLDGYGS
ncbi:ribbon-helix-helix protein, CopG family [Luteolibacter sp. Populi]|uniref:ribbon-helix-helix protein, CopG family n=1 Tax=Luteolibacter sp. Populi TaxID=3230487 RepID=UPI0034653F67